MINAIIFSFDRACQLNLLLESLELNAKNVFNINILYKHSNEEFKQGYQILKERFCHVNWVKEENDKFKEQTLKLMDTDLEFSCFGVDDDVMYGNIKEDEIIKVLKGNDDIICFSPRQGLNTNKCYTMRCDNIILPDKEDKKFIYWDWSKRYADAGYPISLDFHIFRTKEIKKMVKAVNFQTPNILEGNLQIFSENYPKEIMFAYKQSVLVGVPINIVNTTHPNINGERYEISIKELNNRHLSGEVIDYNRIDFAVNAAHCELKYEFKKI